MNLLVKREHKENIPALSCSSGVFFFFHAFHAYSQRCQSAENYERTYADQFIYI